MPCYGRDRCSTRSEFGQRAARRLREDQLAWLTTVSPPGTPQPVPVWFLWDGEASVLFYSRPDTPKLRNIAENPRVTLHLDGNGQGGDIVVCLGRASVSDDPPADQVADYVDEVRSAHRAQPLDACVVRRRLLGAAADRGQPASAATEPGSKTLRDEAAVGDRAAHADRLVDANRRRVLGADEQAHARHLREQPAAEVAHAALREALPRATGVDPDLLELDGMRASRPTPRP